MNLFLYIRGATAAGTARRALLKDQGAISPGLVPVREKRMGIKLVVLLWGEGVLNQELSFMKSTVWKGYKWGRKAVSFGGVPFVCRSSYGRRDGVTVEPFPLKGGDQHGRFAHKRISGEIGEAAALTVSLGRGGTSGSRGQWSSRRAWLLRKSQHLCRIIQKEGGGPVRAGKSFFAVWGFAGEKTGGSPTN